MSADVMHLHSIQTLGTLDGPGLRTVFFLQGCPLRCPYCHNPDTWDMVEDGKVISPLEVLEMAKRYRAYYGCDGGVTFSGGEPLMQAATLLQTLSLLKKSGIHTAVDTSGCLMDETIQKVIDVCDLLLLDIKQTSLGPFEILSSKQHEATQALHAYLRKTQKPVWIRYVLMKGLNDTPAHEAALQQSIKGLHVQKIERLPFHTQGLAKWEALGLCCKLSAEHVPLQIKISGAMERSRDHV